MSVKARRLIIGARLRNCAQRRATVFFSSDEKRDCSVTFRGFDFNLDLYIYSAEKFINGVEFFKNSFVYNIAYRTNEYQRDIYLTIFTSNNYYFSWQKDINFKTKHRRSNPNSPYRQQISSLIKAPRIVLTFI